MDPRFQPCSSSVQGLIGMQCIICGEIFLVKNSTCKIKHNCENPEPLIVGPPLKDHYIDEEVSFDVEGSFDL